MSTNKAWLHIGAGSFHRAHQAWYLHRLIQSGDASWSIALGNIRDDTTLVTFKVLRTMAELKITSQTLTASTAICKLEGDLDGDNFDLLEDEFNKLLESGVLGVVMDLSALESFTSSGLGAIVNMAIVLRARGGKLIAASLRPGVLGTIAMLGAQEAQSVADSPYAARKAIAGGN